MWSSIASIFTGGATTAISEIAKEWITTDMESAEAKAVMVKTLDPNGSMRRQISTTVSALYSIYIMVMLLLIVMQSFALGDVEGIASALKNLSELFSDITMLFGIIVSASFGVNYINTKKGV